MLLAAASSAASHRAMRGLVLACCACYAMALDAKWTPNGEAPAPFSTKARQDMGIDPAAFAGQTQAQGAPLQVPGALLRFNLGALFVVYLANNWKIVLAVQEFIMKLVQPMLDSKAQQKEAQAEALRLESVAAARKARVSRLKQQQKAGGKSRPAVAKKSAAPEE